MTQNHASMRHVCVLIMVFLLALGGNLVGAEPKATNSLGRTSSLQEVVKKWGDTPLNDIQRLAESGDVNAEDYLGYCYKNGLRVPQDATLSVTWYRMAADRGLASAMIELYLFYSDGLGVAQSSEEANKWLTVGAEAGSAYGQCLMGYHYEFPGPRAQGNMEEAVRWYRLSADQNWAGGLYYLGLAYLGGNGVEMDEEKGLELIRKASDLNHTYANYKLSELYAEGIGDPRNEQDQPMALLQRVVKTDPMRASRTTRTIILRYEYGIGTVQDVLTAAEWYLQAALTGVPNYSIGDFLTNTHSPRSFTAFCSTSDGYPIDLIEPKDEPTENLFVITLSHYLNAAISKDPKSLNLISHMYLSGQGTPKNLIKAWVWLNIDSRRDTANQAAIKGIEAVMTSEELKEAKKLLPSTITNLSQVATFVKSSKN